MPAPLGSTIGKVDNKPSQYGGAVNADKKIQAATKLTQKPSGGSGDQFVSKSNSSSQQPKFGDQE